MKIARSSLITALVSALLAGGFIYYARPISAFVVGLFFSTKHKANPEVAKISAMTGHAQVRRAKQTDFVQVVEGAPLRHNDQIRLPDGSEVVLTFRSGHRVRLSPKSLVTLELYHPDEDDGAALRSPALMTVLEGDYELLDRQSPGQLFVMKDHQLYAIEAKPKTVSRPPIVAVATKTTTETLSDLTAPTPKVSREVLTPEKHLTAQPTPTEKISASGQETLSTTYIEDTLAEHSEDLRLCQLKSLRDHNNTDGQMLLSLTIQPSGRVEDVRFIRNELHNLQLSNCVQSVVERTRFKSYAGEPITITYPVEFR